MRGSLLNEFESMRNIALGAEALRAYVAGFDAVRDRPAERVVTLWDLATVLPLVLHELSRRAISKRQVRSGLRAILARDSSTDIAQNEAIFNLNGRIKAMFPRTVRALNCAIAWRFISIEDGAFAVGSQPRHASTFGETNEIIKAAQKLGTWAGQLSAFEYFTILGVEFS